MNLRECMEEKYKINILFFHKVVHKRIAFTHSSLTVCIRNRKDGRYKKNARDLLLSDKLSIQAKVLLSL